jgi:predicted SAM-dependent methyltransferase
MGMKLNIGCGEDIKKGFVNIDIVESVKPDLILDLYCESLLTKFEPGSISLILAQDILEHFEKYHAVQLVKDFYTLLCDKGKLVVRVPDFDTIISAKHDSDLAIWYLFGGQADKNRCHRYAYTAKSLIKLLVVNGFHWESTIAEGYNVTVRVVK